MNNTAASRNTNFNATARNPAAGRNNVNVAELSLDDSTNGMSKMMNTQSAFGNQPNALNPNRTRQNFGRKGNSVVAAYGVRNKMQARSTQRSGSNTIAEV